MKTIKIHNSGLLTTVQDLGRFGYQQFGMPVSGAMDSYSLKIANHLVGNELGEACLECTLMGPEIECLEDTIIGVSGGEAPMKINNESVLLNRTHKLKKGDVLSFGMMTQGCRMYIAFAGGIDVPEVMGSKSTYLRGKLGGYHGRKLESGDEIKIDKSDFNQIRKIPIEYIPQLSDIQEIRIIAGTEVNRFELGGISTFLNSTYTINPQSDRMGYRLNGPKIEHIDGADIISSGISNGAIQVPSHGEPIIMLADRQTVGGYTKIANVISVDLPIMGQLKAGDRVRFKEVKLDEAQQLAKQLDDLINRL